MPEYPGRIFVVCPAGLVTGGPELLHQLVDELRRIGRDASVAYWPFNVTHTREPAYRNKYDAPMAQIEDATANLIIFPDALTRVSREFQHARCAIWWLSVDNYHVFPQNYRFHNPLTRYHGNRFYNPLRRLRTLLTTRRSLRTMRHLDHYAQSAYARTFLAAHGIHAQMLTDYLSQEHLLAARPTTARRDAVAYNPKKGLDVTQALMRALPSIEFIPIQGMSSDEVAALFGSVKLYIDFGHHPGKDRPPREAAIAGCCVITGQSGAAAFEEDIPIPARYRLDPYAPGFVDAFKALVDTIFGDFETREADFDDWRRRIRGERVLFERQVLQHFGTTR